MPKVIEICDVDSDGHWVRFDDGTLGMIPHRMRNLTIGHELEEGVEIIKSLPRPDVETGKFFKAPGIESGELGIDTPHEGAGVAAGTASANPESPAPVIKPEEPHAVDAAPNPVSTVE